MYSRPSGSEVLSYTWLVLFLSSLLNNWDLSDNEWKNVVSSWLGTYDPVHPASPARVSQLSELKKMHRLLPILLYVNRFKTDPMRCSPLHFLAQGYPQLTRIFNGWDCLLCGNRVHGSGVFDAVFKSLCYLLIILEFLLTASPTIALTENLSPTVPVDKSQAPWCGPLLACLRPQCFWRSEYPGFC